MHMKIQIFYNYNLHKSNRKILFIYIPNCITIKTFSINKITLFVFIIIHFTIKFTIIKCIFWNELTISFKGVELYLIIILNKTKIPK